MQIAAAGGGFRLDAASRPTEDLMRIAAAAKSGSARVVFCGLNSRPTPDLQRIGAAGEGAAFFEGDSLPS